MCDRLPPLAAEHAAVLAKIPEAHETGIALLSAIEGACRKGN